VKTYGKIREREMNESAAGYGRVSTERQAIEGTSSEEQERIVREECIKKGWELVHFYSDDGYSGKNAKRPGLVKMLADAKKGKFKTVMFTKLDRFGRSLIDLLNICNDLNGLGVKIFCVSHPEINNEGALGKLTMQIMGAFAEFERSMILERTRQGRQVRAKKGTPGTGRIPHGRVFNKETGTWGVNPKALARIQEAARLYLTTDISMEKLAKHFGMNQMNLRQILVKTAGSEFTQTFTRPDGTKELFTTQIPPLLDDIIIMRIREKAQSKLRWDRAKRKLDYLLGGRILDSDTGLSLTGSHVAKTGRRFYYFHKNGHARYSIDAETIENVVWSSLVEALSDSGSLYKAVFDGEPEERMTESLQKKKLHKEKELDLVNRRIDNTEKLMEFYDGSNLDQFFEKQKPKLLELAQQKDALTQQITQINCQMQTIPSKKKIETMRQELLESQQMSYLSSGHAFNKLPYEEKKKLLNVIFSGKDIDGRRYGVYVMKEDRGCRPFIAYGLLGRLEGWVSSTDSDAWQNYKDFLELDTTEVTERIANEINLLDAHESDEVATDLSREII
jgi:site-specific DNA recombinase